MREKQSALELLLADLSRDQLQAVLLQLAEQDPALLAVIKGQMALFHPPPPPHHPPIDPNMIRRQVRSSIRSLVL